MGSSKPLPDQRKLTAEDRVRQRIERGARELVNNFKGTALGDGWKLHGRRVTDEVADVLLCLTDDLNTLDALAESDLAPQVIRWENERSINRGGTATTARPRSTGDGAP